jgi:hypothetical protein
VIPNDITIDAQLVHDRRKAAPFASGRRWVTLGVNLLPIFGDFDHRLLLPYSIVSKPPYYTSVLLHFQGICKKIVNDKALCPPIPLNLLDNHIRTGTSDNRIANSQTASGNKALAADIKRMVSRGRDHFENLARFAVGECHIKNKVNRAFGRVENFLDRWPARLLVPTNTLLGSRCYIYITPSAFN